MGIISELKRVKGILETRLSVVGTARRNLDDLDELILEDAICSIDECIGIIEEHKLDGF